MSKASYHSEEKKEASVIEASPSRTQLSEKPYIDPAEEKKLLRKLDAWLLTILGALYLLAFLDRGNIGYAQTAGLSKSLKLVDNQYGICVSIVYSTYVFFEPVWTNLLKIVTPRILMATSTLCWGILTLGTGFTKNFNDLVAVRVLLGVAEAGLFPCVNIYLASCYRREEIARRLSYIFCAAAISGGFGGLLAYGLTQIQSGSIKSWQWLYIVEGIISIAFAPIAYFIIPNELTSAWFLKPREKELCAIRYEINAAHYDVDAKFSWHEVKRAVKSWMTWSHGVNQFCVDTTLYGVSTFTPIVVKGLNLTHNTTYSQLLCVPVYALGAISFLIGAHFSDKYNIRSIPMLIYGGIACIGYLILVLSHSASVRYFGVYVTVISCYSMSGLNVAWTNSNNAGHYKRATATGLMQFVGNSSGAAIGFIFSAQTAPRYDQGFWVSFGLTVLSMIITTAHAFALRRINAKRAALIEAGGQVDRPELGDDNVFFVYFL